MRLFFKPEHARVGDIIPFYDNGTFHLFYLKNGVIMTGRTESPAGTG